MLKLDPELRQIFEPLLAAQKAMPVIPRGDWQGRREAYGVNSDMFFKMVPATQDIEIKDFSTTSYDGTEILLRWYKPANSETKSAVLFTHGGGKFLCTLDMYDPLCKYYAAQADVAILSVDFRLPPEHPYPALAEDCYAGLVWLADHAEELNLDPNRIAVMGDSGGGGIAAGVALMTRDRGGPKLAKQILIYPMLDDRNTVEDPDLMTYATWSYDDNYTGWHCYVGDAIGTDEVSQYAAPSREEDLTGLPPTFIDVGELDIFRDESVDYAARLIQAGVSVEFHLYPGTPHGFELQSFGTKLATNAWQARFRALNMLNA